MKNYKLPDRDIYDRDLQGTHFSQKGGDDDYVNVRIFELKLQYSAFEIYKQTLLMEKEKIELELSSAVKENRDFKKSIEELKSNLNTSKHELISYEKKNIEISEELDKLQKHLEQSVHDKQTLSSELSSAKSEIEDLKNKLSSSSGEFIQLENKVQSLEEENTGIIEEKNRYYYEKSEFKRELVRLQEENDNLKNKIKRLDDLEEELKTLRIITSIDSPATDLYKVLHEYRSIDLRQLALQARMTQNKCIEFVKKLQEARIIKINGNLHENPTITLQG